MVNLVTVESLNAVVDTDASVIVALTPAGINDPTYLANERITTGALTGATYTTTATDKILSNNTATNCTVTVAANTIQQGAVIQQLSTGTCTVVAGSGVAFIGSTLATASAGQQIAITKTNVVNTFIVKVA